MRRFDSCILCAILRRRPMISISCVALDAAQLLAAGGCGARLERAGCARQLGVEVGLHDAAGRAAGAHVAAGRCRAPRRGAARAGEAIGRSLRLSPRAGARRMRRRGRAAAGAARERPGGCRCRGRRAAGARRRAAPPSPAHLDAHQLRTHRQHLADLAAQREHRPGHRRRNLDRGLVGHHVGQHLVLGHRIARLDMPGDQLDLGDAFAEVGHLDDMRAHSPQASITRRTRRATRAGPGK